jgi:hypothetical protein
VCDLRHTYVGIREQSPRGFKVVFRQLRRTTTRAARASRYGETRFGALPDQAALELR